MWRCGTCGATVEDDDFEVCWSCGRPRDGGEPAWSGPSEAEPARLYDIPRGGKIRVLAALRDGLQTIVKHPIVLLAVVPPLAWAVVATIAGIPSVAFASRTGLEWRSFLPTLPLDIVLEAIATGLAMVLVLGALRGSASMADALRRVVRCLWRLVVVSLLYGAPFLAILAAGIASLVIVPLAVGLYFHIRFTFSSAAIVIDDAGLVEALRRSWQMTRGNFWRTVVLGLAFAPFTALAEFLGAPASVLCEHLVQTVMNGVLVVAYLQRRGELPPIHAAPDTLGPAAVPTTRAQSFNRTA
jgi:hypothetical protein